MKRTHTTTTTSTQDNTATQRVYRVVATTYQAFCIYVEAESSDEAFDIARRVDGFFWKRYGLGDWEVDHAELVIDASAVELLPEAAHNTL